jgi:hypothetical protein
MKTKFSPSIIFFTLSIVLFSFSKNNIESYQDITSIHLAEIPENVKPILDAKCMGCHSNESKPGKSKIKLNFDKIADGSYSNGKMVSKFGKMVKILNENKMPPKKLLAKYPDKKLTAKESKVLIDWATKQKLILNKE